MIYLRLFTMFLEIGIFGFGGGYATLPLIYQNVLEFGRLTSEEISNLAAIVPVVPGGITINAAAYVGFVSSGWMGALIAAFSVCLPSFVIMLLVTRVLERFRNSDKVQSAFEGIRPVTVGLIAAAAVFVGDAVLVKGPIISATLLTEGAAYYNWIPIGIFLATLVLVGKYKIKPIKVMILMGIAGALLCG